MGTIFALAVSSYFFVISYRLQYAFFLFVFLIPFLPKYIGIGTAGLALSLIRILLMILFMSFVISFMQNSEYISKRISLVYQQNKMLINILLLFFIIKVITLSLGSRELSQYVMLFNDYLFSIFIMTLTIVLIDSEESINRLAKLFFYGHAIVLILILIESFSHHPILTIFSSEGMIFQRDYSKALFREGRYRASGSFFSAILVGEYLIILLPIVIAYIYKNKFKLIFKIIYILLFIYAIYSTGSRSAILMFAAVVYLYTIFILYNKGSKFTRFIVSLFTMIIISIVLYLAYNYISDLIMNFHGRFDLLGGGKETISSTSRALQYVTIFNKMQEAPFFGFGRVQNATILLSDSIVGTIDNYYFWMILEVGLIGILAYFFFLYTLVKTAWHQNKLPYRNYYLLPLLLGLIMEIFYKFLAGNPTNNIYLYIFAGLLSVMKVLQNEKETNLGIKHDVSGRN